MSVRVKSNYLIYDGIEYKCSIGKGGFTDHKKEGDGCTPIGVFNITDILYRSDKLESFDTNYELKSILPSDGWCDDPSSENYNTKVKFPFSKSAEKLFRQDNIYDIVCVTDHNQNPVKPGAGSAIFIHIAGEDYSNTAGCVALRREDLIKILSTIKKTTKIYFGF
tara:strand:- start:229 stop:723 length:495 start_codon:yes stop_codon:yes gene_type:complete